MDSGREPCPARILVDIGAAYSMGAIGGSIFRGIGGYRHAPPGARISGAINGARLRGPTMGGQFAAWGGLYSSFDCALAYMRGKEDPINSITSGALTGGVLSIRQGARMAMKSAVGGGVILALIEGVTFVMSRQSQPSAYVPPPPAPMEALVDEEEPSESWFGWDRLSRSDTPQQSEGEV